MEPEKIGIDNFIHKAEIETDVENKRRYQGGRGGGGMNWEIGINIYTLLILCIKQITNEIGRASCRERV